MASNPFSVGGHNFVLRYFPNGGSAGGYADVVSFSLVPESADAEDAEMKARLTVLGKDGQHVPHYGLLVDRRNGLCTGYNIHHADLERSAHILAHDCLNVRFDVAVEKDIRNEDITGDRFVVVPPSDLHLHFGEEKFLAHRFVLAARSPLFKAELLGDMKEKVGCPIEIHEMEAVVFKCLLHYLYTDSLPAINVVMAGHLLEEADMYDVERLKRMCEHKLCSNTDADMVVNSLVLAHQHNCNGLKEACLQFLASPSNLEAIKASDAFNYLKSSCPSALKELIASLLPAEMKAAKEIIMEM